MRHHSRLTGFDSHSVIPKTSKTVIAACPASCSALMFGCKERVPTRCFHWLAINAAFTAKAEAGPTVQARGDARATGRSWHSERSTKAACKGNWTIQSHVTDQGFTEFGINANHFQPLDGKSRLFPNRQKVYADRWLRATGLNDQYWHFFICFCVKGTNWMFGACVSSDSSGFEHFNCCDSSCLHLLHDDWRYQSCGLERRCAGSVSWNFQLSLVGWY